MPTKMKLEHLRAALNEAVDAKSRKTASDRETEHQERKQSEAAAKRNDKEYSKELFHSGVNDAYGNRAKALIESDPYGGKGFKMGRLVRFAGLAANGHCSVIDIAKQMGDDWMVEDLQRAKEQKQLVTNIGASGGLIVPDEYNNDMIELLRSRTAVRRAGARQIPMRSGSMTIPRQNSPATASYGGESENAVASQPGLDQIQLTAKKLKAVVGVSNDLLRESDPSADAFVRDDLIKVMALREDLAFLRGAGTVFEPKGLRNWVAAANILNAHAGRATAVAATAAEISDDLYGLLSLIEETDVEMVRPAWFMRPAVKIHLMSLRDGNNNLIFGNEMARGVLLGMPFFDTTQIPNNLDASATGDDDESELYLVEATEMLIGDTLDLQLEVFPNGTYDDGGLRSGISRDETAVRAISKHDFALRHDGSASIATGVDWGQV